MIRKKMAGVCLAICVMGAALTACSAGGRTEDGSPVPTEESAAYADGIAEGPGNDGETGRTASGDMDGTVSGQRTENESASPAALAGGRKENSGSGGNGNSDAAENAAGTDMGQGAENTASDNPATEDELPPELLEDAYLNGPDICPDVTFVPDGPVTTGGGRFLLSAAEDGDVWCYDEFEILKRYMHGEWHRVPVLTGFCGNTSYFDVPADKPETMETEWQWLYGELPPGTYCLVKDVYPQKILDAEYKDLEERAAALEEARKYVCAPFIIHGGPDIQMEVWDITPTGLKLQFTRMPGKEGDKTEYNFGSWYELEQYTEGEWKPVPTHVKGKYAWEDLAYRIPAEGSQVLEIDWEWLYGYLEDGTYRIHKSIYPEKDASQDLPMYTAFYVEKCREELV